MPRSKDAVEKSLRKKGFHETQGDHHYFTYHDLNGKKTTVYTKTSHTPKMKELSDPLLSQMAKQVKLTKQEFMDFIDCTLTQVKYEEKLKSLGC